ncbi:cystine/glutamate transporter-like isoform X3 [Rhinatrema bivittatum]|uniref:cystine/glutamate transporter-like isoform X3 n=1 Tax=Rhinatrema bivittatum TaxID=194408 RepID=UPI00112BD05F|nr:cystine/glutamate transporter-like isoform X3 [Rhinatrema bivittatum]
MVKGKGGSDVKRNTGEDTVFLRRKITLVRAISLTIGTMVGSGIFISPKGVLKNSGSVGLSLLVWFACGIISMLGALSYAELGTCIKKSGGNYIYLLETLGPVPAFLRLWSEFVMIRPANIAVVSLAFGRYLIEPFFIPCHAPSLAVKLITSLGICHFENFQNAFDTSKMDLDNLPLAFYSGMFAYGGWFYINFVTEEVVNPERTIPITVIISLITVTIGYILTNVSYHTILSIEEVLESEAVAMSFADQTLKGFSSAIPLLVAMSCFGSLHGGIFASARMLFAASREGHWPSLFSMIHIQRHTPLPSLILMMPLILLMVFMGDIYGLLNFYSFSRWFFMGLVTIGLIVHRYRYPELPRPFKVPLIIPGLFSVMCIFIVTMSLYSDPVNTGIGCAITLTGLPVYYLLIHRAQQPSSITGMYSFITEKLQILMEVIPQEIQTF